MEKMPLSDGVIKMCIDTIAYIETNQIDKEICINIIGLLKILAHLLSKMTDEEIYNIIKLLEKNSGQLDTTQSKQILDEIIRSV